MLKAVEIVYRRRVHTTTWHFSPDCEAWPNIDFFEVTQLPPDAPLCTECLRETRTKFVPNTARKGKKNRAADKLDAA